MYVVVKTFPEYKKLSVPMSKNLAIYYANLLNEDKGVDNKFDIEELVN